MSSNTENIEAKLCAYVEGDLDEQGRVEIEKHLQSNPQHRLLLEELRQTKVMMQALPREVAPPELAETLHGQLERSVLLDGVGADDVAHTMKISRWPQLMAVAAVLVLASGLGVLVYVVLPKHGDTTIAVRDTAPPDASTLRSSSADKVDAKASADAREEFGKPAAKGEIGPGGGKFAENRDDAALAKTEGAADSPKKSKDAFGEGGGGQIAADLNLGSRGIAGDGVGLKSGEPVAAAAAPQRVYVVLSTDNLPITNGNVARYLDSNKINYGPAEPSVQQVFLSRANRTNVEVRVAGLDQGNLYNNNTINPMTVNTAAGGGGNNTFPKDGGGYAAKGTSSPAAPAAKPASKAGPDDQSPQQAPYRQQYDLAIRARNGQDQLAGQQQVPTQQAPTQPQTPAAQPDQAALEASQVVQRQALHEAPAAQQQAMPAFNLAESTTENVIVARGLTREQAVTVVESLGKLYTGQTAVVVDRNLLEDLPKVAQIEKGLADAVVPPSTQPTDAATTQPAMSDEQAEAKRWANIPAAGLDRQFGIVDPPTTQPAPTAVPAPDLAPPSTQPANQTVVGGVVVRPEFEQQGASKELNLNVAPSTRPAEQPLELVIVVQPAEPAPAEVPAATGPATPGQPAPPASVAPANPMMNDAPAAEAPANEAPADVAAKPAAAPSTQPGPLMPAEPDIMQQDAK